MGWGSTLKAKKSHFGPYCVFDFLLQCSVGFRIESAKMPPIFLEKTRASQYEFEHDSIHSI
jgi:hypothetical protein